MNDEPKAKPEDAANETAAPAEDTKPTSAEATGQDASAESEPAAEAVSDAKPSDPEADPPADEPAASEADDPPGDKSPWAGGDEAALQAENADLKDRLLRAAAEMENMRRRFEREMSDTRQYAVTGFAREVLSIGDNLGRALGAVSEEARQEDGPLKSLIEGVEMTERELIRVLDKHGVKRLDPHGEKFDPNFHQAMFEVEHDEAPQGTVVQVMQHGYSIGNRVLRPAMVGIAKASKKPAPEEAAKQDEAKAEPAEASDSQQNAANDG